MKLSINIITMNRKEMLLRLLKSIESQLNDDMEIIILDNGGTDNTYDYIEQYLQTLPCYVDFEYSTVNYGVAGGRNRTFNKSKGEYIISLDDDAIVVTSDFFDKIIEKMDNNPKIFAMGVEIFEPETNFYHGQPVRKKDNFDIMFCFAGGGHVIRRDKILRSFLYPDNLIFGSEELYVGLQIYAQGGIIVYSKDIKMEHLPQNINRILDNRRTIEFLINSYIIKKMIYPFILLPFTNILFKMRFLKHKGQCIYSRNELKNILKERYKNEYISRISIFSFVRISLIFRKKIIL